MDLQVRRDSQVLRALLDCGVLMGRKVGVANQGYQTYLAHLVFVVTWEIQVLEVKRGPLLSDPQASPVYLEKMVRKESLETLLMATQDPQEREVFQGRQD